MKIQTENPPKKYQHFSMIEEDIYQKIKDLVNSPSIPHKEWYFQARLIVLVVQGNLFKALQPLHLTLAW